MRKMTFIFVVAIVLCGMICSCTNGVSEKEKKKSEKKDSCGLY